MKSTRLTYIIITFLIGLSVICLGQNRPMHRVGPSRRISDTSIQSCNYSFFTCGDYIFDIIKNKCVDTISIGNVTGFCWLPRNKTNKLIRVKQLAISTMYSCPDFVKLAGINDIISYFECDYLFYSVIARPTYKDTLDFGNAKKAFVRSFQLPVIKKMKVVRHHRLDTILTNDSTDYFINFHGRRVFVKTYLKDYPHSK